MNTIAFFNNKGGVGKSTLVYHVAWTLADLGVDVVVADLDPQANLTSMFLEEERLAKLWPDDDHVDTVLGAVGPILRGLGDVRQPHVEEISDAIGLVVGDLGLSRIEDRLSQDWHRCLDQDEAAFRMLTAFYRMMLMAAEARGTEIVLIDVGPNLGAIKRAALLGTDHVVMPLAPDLFSLQGLRNLGPALRDWREGWAERRQKAPRDLDLPTGAMAPAGYVVLQHNVRLDRPMRANAKWMARIPSEYRGSVLDEPSADVVKVDKDPHCLAQLKHYRSLMPMAIEARKPIFHLKPADGALGSRGAAARKCGEDFRQLTRAIADKAGIRLP
ncbi:MAG: ParA family protein [Oligoflexia bacterium]|nr:ParA family protein [Oligoflexia bacterium]